MGPPRRGDRSAPRFRYRGLLLDVARWYYPPEFIEKVIDLLALYKLNVLHLHLTDDQGWRLEIKQYPRLAQVGAWRKGPSSGRTSTPSSAMAGHHGGLYTQEQMRDLVASPRRATSRSCLRSRCRGRRAALAAYPELSAPAGPSRYRPGGACTRTSSARRADLRVPPGRAPRGDGAVPQQVHPHRRRRSAEKAVGGQSGRPGGDSARGARQ